MPDLYAAGAWAVPEPPAAAATRKRRPPLWRHSPGRVPAPAPSPVEAALRQKYYAAAEPQPVDLDAIKKLLANEPTPAWAVTPRRPTAQSFCGPGCTEATGIHAVAAGAAMLSCPLPTPRAMQQQRSRPPSTPPFFASSRARERQLPMATESRLQERFLRYRAWAAASEAVPPGLEMAAEISERLQQLTSQSREASLWVLVETCRDCSQHEASLRHNEQAYITRYHQLKEALQQAFPEGLAIDLLVPSSTARLAERPSSARYRGAGTGSSPIEPLGPSLASWRGVSPRPSGGRAGPPADRIGAFEVYFCYPSHLRLPSAAEGARLPLPRPSRAGAPAMEFSAVLVASKLRTRAWPATEAVLGQLAQVVPTERLEVSVRTALDLPLPGVEVLALPAMDADVPEEERGGMELPFDSSRTDFDGLATVSVPMLLGVRVRAWCEGLMEIQERELRVCSARARVDFESETVVQLWQAEAAKELVVYCSSPRVAQGLQEGEGLVPFRGRLRCANGATLTPDASGSLRGRSDPLQGAQVLLCNGWRSARLVASAARDVHVTGRVVEVGRLPAPVAEVSLVSGCCAAPVPAARVAVDGEACGSTGEEGSPVSCCVKCGEHVLHADHGLLAPEGLRMPFVVSPGHASCSVQVELPPERLRLLCRSVDARRAELWLVGGDLARWRGAGEVWLWDGELRREEEPGAALLVRAGIAAESRALGASCREGCPLAGALAGPCCNPGPWRVILHADGAQEMLECPAVRLARLAEGGAPAALWVAQLARGEGAPRSPSAGSRLSVRTACCCSGYEGLEVHVDGEAAGATDADGELELPSPADGFGDDEVGRRLRLRGAPGCLLPGGTGRLVARDAARLELEVQCLLWIYWVPAGADEDEEPQEEEEEGGTLFVCADSDQVPDEAQPVEGVLRCPEAEEGEVPLCGRFIRPIALRRPAGSGSCRCLLAGLEVQVRAPEGLAYRAKDPPPLAERCADLGGCELQRLVHCPAALGYLEPARQTPAAGR